MFQEPLLGVVRDLLPGSAHAQCFTSCLFLSVVGGSTLCLLGSLARSLDRVAACDCPVRHILYSASVRWSWTWAAALSRWASPQFTFQKSRRQSSSPCVYWESTKVLWLG